MCIYLPYNTAFGKCSQKVILYDNLIVIKYNIESVFMYGKFTFKKKSMALVRESAVII